MRTKVEKSVFVIVVTALVTAIAVLLSPGTAKVSAQNGRSGQFHLEKDCRTYAGGAGQYCTVHASNLPEIPPGSSTMTKRPGVGVKGGPNFKPYWLDSNVVIDASPFPLGTGNKAIGRCTVDLGPVFSPTSAAPFSVPGVCTFSDGAGQLAGFTARVDLSYLGGADGFVYGWDGTYSFNPFPPK
jgi:hypothetical protein